MKIKETSGKRSFELKLDETDLIVLHAALGKCSEVHVKGSPLLYNQIDLVLYPHLDDDERG